MRTFAVVSLLYVVGALGGCSNGFLMAKPEVTMFGVAYPPWSVDATIEVFQSRQPDRAYAEIARIEVADTDDNWSIKQILVTAREIGADAVIITGKSGSYAMGSSSYAVAKEYGMVATAIKFKLPSD